MTATVLEAINKQVSNEFTASFSYLSMAAWCEHNNFMGAGAWLRVNAWKYGFVMSYPKGKTAVTCYQYEPWHYRYVGRTRARLIRSSGLTLREFLWREQNPTTVTPTPTPTPTPSPEPTPTPTPIPEPT